MWYLDGAVVVLKLLLTLKGLPQQQLECCGADSVSDVISFSLAQVIIPSWSLLRSSSLRRVFVD